MTASRLRIADINSMDPAGFLAAFGGVFEHSPWVAERAWARKPFADLPALHAAMVAAVREASVDEQLALLRSHPELAGKEAQTGTLTDASTHEQKTAGLTSLSKEEMQTIARLNAAYGQRFGHPFIIAARLNSKAKIFSEFERRLANDPATEREACLQQVYLITGLRLQDAFGEGAK